MSEHDDERLYATLEVGDHVRVAPVRTLTVDRVTLTDMDERSPANPGQTATVVIPCSEGEPLRLGAVVAWSRGGSVGALLTDDRGSYAERLQNVLRETPAANGGRREPSESGVFLRGDAAGSAKGGEDSQEASESTETKAAPKKSTGSRRSRSRGRSKAQGTHAKSTQAKSTQDGQSRTAAPAKAQPSKTQNAKGEASEAGANEGQPPKRRRSRGRKRSGAKKAANG